MKIKEKVKTKKDELVMFVEEHDKEIGYGIMGTCAAIWLGVMSYGIGRWRVAKYATGLMYLAKEAGIMKFDSWEFINFIQSHPQKDVFKDWKRISKMK